MMINYGGHFLVCSLAFHKVFCSFLIGLFPFYYRVRSSLYNLDISNLPDTCIANTFSQSVTSLFVFSMICFDKLNFFFNFWFCVLGGSSGKKNLSMQLVLLLLLFKNTFWASSLRFTAKIERKVQRCPMFSCPNICTASSKIYIPHQSGTFFTTDEPTLTHNNDPKSIVYSRVHSW